MLDIIVRNEQGKWKATGVKEDSVPFLVTVLEESDTLLAAYSRGAIIRFAASSDKLLDRTGTLRQCPLMRGCNYRIGVRKWVGPAPTLSEKLVSHRISEISQAVGIGSFPDEIDYRVITQDVDLYELSNLLRDSLGTLSPQQVYDKAIDILRARGIVYLKPPYENTEPPEVDQPKNSTSQTSAPRVQPRELHGTAA